MRSCSEEQVDLSRQVPLSLMWKEESKKQVGRKRTLFRINKQESPPLQMGICTPCHSTMMRGVGDTHARRLL